jgi:SAM-dependent methyltransferase
MLCGADRLQALDVVRYASAGHNQSVLEELAGLLRARAPIPDEAEFPGVFPTLDDYSFPEHLMPADELRRTLDPDRVTRIGLALRGEESDVAVDYRVPWNARAPTSPERVDLLYSQAVLEHVEDPAATWQEMARWVAPGGAISHVIDLRSHRLTAQWDGHLQYPDFWWRVVKGRRPYLLNRRSPTEHLGWIESNGFRALSASRAGKTPALRPQDLAAPFRQWSDEDRQTATVHLIGVRES